MSLPPAESHAELQSQTTALLCPLALGGQFFMILYGLYLVQHFQYCRSTLYAKLTRPVKSTLWIVCFLVTTYMGLIAADVTYWMVTIDRSPLQILLGVRLDMILPMFGCFLVRRSWVRWGFLAAVGLCILVSLCGSVLTCAAGLMYLNETIERLLPFDYNDGIAMWLWVQTDSLLRRLIQTALLTASYTAFLAVTGAALATGTADVAVHITLVHWAFWIPLPACYALSLYTTLSARRMVNDYLCSRPTGGARAPAALPLHNADAATRSVLGSRAGSDGAQNAQRSARDTIKWEREEKEFASQSRHETELNEAGEPVDGRHTGEVKPGLAEQDEDPSDFVAISIQESHSR
ncbi:hypothetical protein Rhopal_004277-T1 [Rhodotorula paludigena]|uniref:Uncharacterized protein n=1 Tax=Rhodotorula paludigena TaxID=86838 RepID=A0AAV5GM16_9BASI|nr:hypothetical protein Rhopal_004277-T1 [Rhodotorula paludigena]